MTKRKDVENIVYSKIIIKRLSLLVGFVLLATVTFWWIFFATLFVINAIPIYGLGTCVPAVFSAFIAGLVVIFIAKESDLSD